MHKTLHPRDNIDTLYLSKKEGGRGSALIEASVNASIRQLEDYILKSKERLITAANNKTGNIKTNRTTITSKQK